MKESKLIKIVFEKLIEALPKFRNVIALFPIIKHTYIHTNLLTYIYTYVDKHIHYSSKNM
jgi:hypothetical protein